MESLHNHCIMARSKLTYIVQRYIFSFAYPFPDVEVAASTDIPYISRSAAVRPTLQTLAPNDVLHIHLPISIQPCVASLVFTFPSVINVSSVWCIVYVRNNLIVAFQQS